MGTANVVDLRHPKELQVELSMWDIYYSLGYDNAVSMIQTGQPTIKKARLIASSYLNDETVYVGRASDFLEAKDDDSLIVHREDMILVRGVTFEYVFDELCVILDTYDIWEQSIEGFVTHEDGLQKMLDASAGILKVPAFVYAPDGRAFAISREYPPDVHWHWAEILEEGGISSERLRYLRDSINLPDVWKDAFPKIRESKMGAHEYLHCSLFPNGYMAGHLVLFGFDHPFDKGLPRIVNILASAMTRHMEQFYARYNPVSKMGGVFSSFLSGDALDDEELTLDLRALRWDEDDTFRVYAMQERSDVAPVLISSLYAAIAQRFPFAISFISEDCLIVIENESHRDADDDMSAQLPSIIKSDFLCGISNPFEGIRRCRTFILQARNELEESKRTGQSFSHASDHGLAYFNRVFSSDDLMHAYAYSELTHLKRYDEDNQTQFFETLRAYAYSGFRLSDAARYLGIHRNSLTYRLDRIRHIIDFGLIDKLGSQPNEEALVYLMLSFAVIGSRNQGQQR